MGSKRQKHHGLVLWIQATYCYQRHYNKRVKTLCKRDSSYILLSTTGGKSSTIKSLRGTITKYANWLNAREAIGKLHYSVEISSCVSHTSRALNLSGIFNIGIHPYLLNAQMYLWSNGIRPWTFSYFLNQ